MGGLNSANITLVQHFLLVEKVPIAVLKEVTSSLVFFRLRTTASVARVQLAPESSNALKVTYVSFSRLTFKSMKLTGTTLAGPVFLRLFL